MKLAHLLIPAALWTASAATAETTDFSNGAEGWIGNAVVDTSLGNTAPSFHTQAESFGISWRNDSNAGFLGDYTRSAGVTISLDVLTNSITYLGTEVTRGLFAAAGGIPRALQQLPAKVGMRLILTGAPMSATEAAARLSGSA